MRSFAFVLPLLSLSSQCTGFSASSQNVAVSNRSSRTSSALSATTAASDDFRHKAATFATTLALGWAVGSSACVAAPLSSNDYSSVVASSSSSVVLAVSDSDFADFSLPSYKEVTDSAVNTNLKGGKVLFGGDVVEALSSSSGSSSAAPVAVEKKAPTAAELKAEKMAAKAAQNAARAAQQAAVEAQIAAGK